MGAVARWARMQADVSALSVVGSYAYGHPRMGSDVDLALLTNHPDKLQVELGIVGPGWASLPLEPGTERVLRDGCRILYDPQGRLKGALSAT